MQCSSGMAKCERAFVGFGGHCWFYSFRCHLSGVEAKSNAKVFSGLTLTLPSDTHIRDLGPYVNQNSLVLFATHCEM